MRRARAVREDETYACNVRVLGTKFNVNRSGAHDRFSTALIRIGPGLRPADKPESLVLEPTRRRRSSIAHLCAGTVSSHDVYRWQKGIVNLTGCVPGVDGAFQAFGVRIEIRRGKTLPTLGFNWGKLRVSSRAQTTPCGWSSVPWISPTRKTKTKVNLRFL